MTATQPTTIPADRVVSEIIAAGETLLGGALATNCLHDRLTKVRERDKGFYATFASALESSGQPMGPAWAAERALMEQRARRCAEIAARLMEATGATELKGQRLAGLYPSGVLRQCRDLDLQLPDAERLFGAAELLITSGWSIDVLVVLPGAVEPDFILELSRPRPTLAEAPDKVELTTLLLQGDGLRMDRVRRLPGIAGAGALLAAVAAEGMDRPFRLRDCTDAHLLMRRLDPDAREALRRAAERVGLGRYMARLVRSTHRFYPCTTHGLVIAWPDSWRARGGGLRSRAVRVVGGRTTIRLAQMLAVYRHRSWTKALLNRVAQDIGAGEALAGGLNLYCRPGMGPASNGLTCTGRNTIATPVGTFVAVAGTSIPCEVGRALCLDETEQPGADT
jgi:hypothetical protein